jgi:hypothetical protein
MHPISHHAIGGALTGRKRGFAALILALLLASQSSALEPIKSYSTLTLKDGRKFVAVEIINYTSNGVFVRHADGLTTFRTTLLPDNVVAELHLPAPKLTDLIADASLADRPAVVETASAPLANRIAVADTNDSDLAQRPAIVASTPDATAARPPLTDGENAATADLSNLVATAPAAAAPDSRNLPPPPAGEGNMPEFFQNQQPVISAPTTHVDVAGRVTVSLPSGETCMLADVEIRAYPANLLARYLSETKARCNESAQRLAGLAAVAQKEGRGAEAQALLARANDMSASYLNYLPEAPCVARSDEFGYFTLRNDLQDLRIVAAGRVTLPRGEWSYQWVGVAVARETLLTEANATAIAAPRAAGARFAVR